MEGKIIMENLLWKKLKPHIGHRVVCVCYGDFEDPCDICIECEDCGEVLVSAEDYDLTAVNYHTS